jgi:F-type H+-transporting ATPase subunit delta
MSHGQAAERYGRAIFELGLEAGTLSKLCDEVELIAKTYRSNADLKAALDNPAAGEAERGVLVDEVSQRLALSAQAKNALMLLAVRRRLPALQEIAERVRQLADEHNGVVRVTLTSAEPLSESYASQLISQLEQATGRKVIAERKVDSSLIAGVVTTLGDRTLDGSVSGRLKEMKTELFAVE